MLERIAECNSYHRAQLHRQRLSIGPAITNPPTSDAQSDEGRFSALPENTKQMICDGQYRKA